MCILTDRLGGGSVGKALAHSARAPALAHLVTTYHSPCVRTEVDGAQKDPEKAHWLASLIEMASFRFGQKLCLKGIKYKAVVFRPLHAHVRTLHTPKTLICHSICSY